MNILLLTQFFSETRGGGEYVFKLLANFLVKNNHKVWIITNKIVAETYDSQENLNIIFVKPTLSYDSGKLPTFSGNLRYSINAIREGRKIIKKEKIDIIHSNNFAPALAGAILSSIMSKPHILTIHDVFSLCGKNYWKRWGAQSDVSKINVMLAPIFEKLIIRLKHDCIHTVSEATRDDLVKLGAKKPICVVYNAIETVDIEKSDLMPFQFIYIGRLVFYKNLEVVIKAISIVKKEYPKVSLIIAGGGPHRASLERLVNDLKLQDNVKFTGFVSAKEKNRLLASSQALVFPSLCEGFGLAILEAFSHKKPVLVSNVRPLSDIVSDKLTGFVLPPHDEKEWVKALENIISDPQNSHRIGLAGNELLETTYTIGKMRDKVLKMYNDLI